MSWRNFTVCAAPTGVLKKAASGSAAALPLASRLVLTEVNRDFEADVFFPEWDKAEWLEISRETNQDAVTSLDYDFVDYQLKVRS